MNDSDNEPFGEFHQHKGMWKKRTVLTVYVQYTKVHKVQKQARLIYDVMSTLASKELKAVTERNRTWVLLLS